MGPKQRRLLVSEFSGGGTIDILVFPSLGLVRKGTGSILGQAKKGISSTQVINARTPARKEKREELGITMYGHQQCSKLNGITHSQ